MFPALLRALVIASVTAAAVAQAEDTASSCSTAGFVSCVGDCDGDDVVGISELLTLVNLALGLPGDCPGLDGGGAGIVTINVLVTAVNNAQNGCPAVIPGPTNISAFVTDNGDLVIKGNNEDNEIALSQGTSPDEVVITGLNGTTVNGQTTATVADVTDDFEIDLRGGDDFVRLKELEVPGDLKIIADAGNDDLQITDVGVGSDVAIKLSGEDNVILDGVWINHSLEIDDGRGKQSLLIQHSGVSNEVKIELGTDDDRVGAFDNVFADKVEIALGSGDDECWFEDNIVHDKLSLDGGRDEDEVTPDVEARNALAEGADVEDFEANTELLEDVEFGYIPGIGPEVWHLLTPAWLYNTVGRSQSPINFTPDILTEADLPDLQFNYGFENDLEFSNTGDNIEVSWETAPGNTLVDKDGTVYELVQSHLHTPAEHAIDGVLEPGDLHLVHKDPNTGNLLVVSVQIVEGLTPSGAWTELIGKLITDGLPTTVSLDATELLPAGDRYFAYSGSLTTPPNTEGVEWRVMIEPIGLSAADIAAMHAEITSSPTVGPDGNDRPTQPINSRVVLFDIS